jgi:hypothetical protein
MRPANSLEKKTMAPVRHVVLAIALTAAAAAPALGQKAPAGGQAARAAPSTGSAPDFSGIWSHPYLTGFEPAVSGHGPILNRQRTRNGVANFQLLVGDYTNPILQPWAAAIVKKYGEISLSGVGLTMVSLSKGVTTTAITAAKRPLRTAVELIIRWTSNLLPSACLPALFSQRIY